MKSTAARALQAGRVRDVMQMHVVTAVPEMTVRELAHMLLESGVPSVPVPDPAGKVLGVASQADVTRAAFGSAAEPPGTPVSGDGGTDALRVRDVMGPVGLTVAPDDRLPSLIQRFLRGGAGPVPVVYHDLLLGIVTPMDVLGAIGEAF